MTRSGGGAPTPRLEVTELAVRLGGRDVLESVSFSLGDGELTGLIGSNGAGKTTLLRAILGLVRPSRGTITVAGDRRAVGYVPQRIGLDPDLPVRARDLVALGLDGHRYGIRRRSAAERIAVEEVLDAVGATHLAEARVGMLSGGEQQRVLIAHALVSHPRLLLLDEPLANLDLHAESDVVEVLGRVAKRQQITVLLSAHEINPLVGVMDRVVYLAGGRAASGTTAEVVRSDVLSSLYGHHVDVISVGDRVVVLAGRAGGHHHEDEALR